MVFGDRFKLLVNESAGPSGRDIWSFKTLCLSWQWSLKTDFTVYSYCVSAKLSSNRTSTVGSYREWIAEHRVDVVNLFCVDCSCALS